MRLLISNSRILIRIHLILTATIVFSCTIRAVIGDEDVGVLGQVRNFLGELGNIASEVTSGIQKLNRQIRTVEEFLDATVDEDCYFECHSDQIRQPKPGHVPSSNGCGSYGIEEYLNGDYLPLTEFIDCCNSHDICYETCGADRDECDLKFKKCLYGKCRSVKDSVSKLKFKGCQAGAKILYTGTTAMGCKPYLEAQNEACVCIPRNKKYPSRSDEF